MSPRDGSVWAAVTRVILRDQTSFHCISVEEPGKNGSHSRHAEKKIIWGGRSRGGSHAAQKMSW